MSRSLTLAAAEEPTLRDWWALLKPRVMSLVVFTATVGFVAAPGAAHPVLALAAILCIAVGAGASGALNQWWDADIDARMRRTAERPVPSGRVASGEAAGFGLGLGLLSIAMLAVFANLLAAALLAFTIFFYAVVYTMWLKRLTAQNIVIGGLAGALPPLVGWTAASGSLAWEPALMVLVIFLWTPAHFWALALWTSEDYRGVGVPMLPVTAGDAATRRGVLGYGIATCVAATLLAFTAAGGPATLLAGVLANVALLRGALKVAARDARAAHEDRMLAEKKLFGVSILYLFVLFGGVAVDAALAWRPSDWPTLF